MSDVFYVHSAKTAQHGLMICAACSKPIETGQYRVKDTPDAYITHHRACLPLDPMWERMDAEKAEQIRNMEMMLADAEAFRKRWDTEALDELIGELQEYLAQRTKGDAA